jgi:hypothetical protein
LKREFNKNNTFILERALFALESASFKFRLISSEDQLDYNWRDNRVLFNLLWNQIQIMSGRRCFSTALEYAKILYGKNSEDPLATTLIFDALALKGKNYQFLVDFYEQFGVSFLIIGGLNGILKYKVDFYEFLSKNYNCHL